MDRISIQREFEGLNPIGVAIHEVIFDEKGRPDNYRYLSINDEFEKITGISKKNEGKLVTEVFPSFKSGKTNWIKIYGDLTLSGKEKVFEEYSEQIARWFNIHVKTMERKYFATYIKDITSIKTIESVISFFNEENREVIDFGKILKHIKEMTGAKFAAVNIYNKTDRIIKTLDIYPKGKRILKTLEKLNLRVVDSDWPLDDLRENIIYNNETYKKIFKYNNIEEIAKKAISGKILKSINEMLSIGSIYFIPY